MIQNIKDQISRIVSSEITRENYIVQLEFKYELYEYNLLESLFNPLFFLRNINLKKTISKLSLILQKRNYATVSDNNENLENLNNIYISRKFR